MLGVCARLADILGVDVLIIRISEVKTMYIDYHKPYKILLINKI